MQKKITGIEAAMMEYRGGGEFSIVGRTIVFKAGIMTWEWQHKSPKEAETVLKVLRAAPKYQNPQRAPAADWYDDGVELQTPFE